MFCFSDEFILSRYYLIILSIYFHSALVFKNTPHIDVLSLQMYLIYIFWGVGGHFLLFIYSGFFLQSLHFDVRNYQMHVHTII